MKFSERGNRNFHPAPRCCHEKSDGDALFGHGSDVISVLINVKGNPAVRNNPDTAAQVFRKNQAVIDGKAHGICQVGLSKVKHHGFCLWPGLYGRRQQGSLGFNPRKFAVQQFRIFAQNFPVRQICTVNAVCFCQPAFYLGEQVEYIFGVIRLRQTAHKRADCQRCDFIKIFVHFCLR